MSDFLRDQHTMAMEFFPEMPHIKFGPSNDLNVQS